jgi:hypothetical protein
VNMRVKRMSRDGFEKRKGSIVCAKCFYLTKADDYLTLRWWLELNRVTGHDRVFMCDHAIEKDRVFDELFEEYKDFIVFGRLKVRFKKNCSSESLNSRIHLHIIFNLAFWPFTLYIMLGDIFSCRVWQFFCVQPLQQQSSTQKKLEFYLFLNFIEICSTYFSFSIFFCGFGYDKELLK